MLPSEQKLVEEVIQRITMIQRRSPDDLDIVEMIMDLQAEFGEQAVKWAFRFLLARGAAQDARPVPAEPDPMWDRDLDG